MLSARSGHRRLSALGERRYGGEHMQIEKRSEGSYALQVDCSELVILNNALNEICNGIDVEEFSTRMGATREAAELMLRRISSMLDGTAVG